MLLEEFSPCSPFQAARIFLGLHVCAFLLVVCLPLSLALLWCLDWLRLQPSHSRGEAKRTTRHRLLKPRCPNDRPACRLASTPSLDGGSAPLHVRPWSEVKSRRGAPKRIPTDGFACPNQQCAYFGITDASIHALVGDGKHGQAEHIQTFRGPACRTTLTSRRNTPLYRLKTPAYQVAMVLSALAEGLDPSATSRVFGFRQATIIIWLSRAGEHAQALHQRFFSILQLPHLQLDELRTRLRCTRQVLWLWVAIDPCTKLLPVLQLGPRTQHMAHLLIHSLRQILAPGCLPLFTSDGLNLYFYAALRSFWTMAPGGSERAEHASLAGGSGVDLRAGEEKLPMPQAGSGHPRHAPGDTSRSHRCLAEVRLLWSAEYSLYRASESHRAKCAWKRWHAAPGRRPSKFHTCLLTWNGDARIIICTSSRIVAGSVRAAPRARWQAGGTTLPAAYPSHGSWQNHPTMDDAGSAVPSLIVGALRPHGSIKGVRRSPEREQVGTWRR